MLIFTTTPYAEWIPFFDWRLWYHSNGSAVNEESGIIGF